MPEPRPSGRATEWKGSGDTGETDRDGLGRVDGREVLKVMPWPGPNVPPTWTANPSLRVFDEPLNVTMSPDNWALWLARRVSARVPKL